MKFNKKTIGNALAMALVISNLSVLPASAQQKNVDFTDITGHWAEAFIKEFARIGYINGYGDGTFRPNNKITRAEFIKIVNLSFGITAKGTENFTDVNEGDWFYNDVVKAANAGYIEGYGDGTFKPNDYINREEACKIVGIVLKAKGNGNTNFTDDKEIADWAKEYVKGLVDLGIINGFDDNTFKPKNNTTRAESVKTLKLARDNKNNTGGGGIITPPQYISVRGISIVNNITAEVGKDTQLTATVSPSNATNKSVTWTSNNTDVAIVDKTTGKVTAKKSGIAIITATTVDGKKEAKCTVTVADTIVTETQSIQKVIDEAKPGDTILVKKGQYAENLTIKKSINIIGEDKINTVLNGKINASKDNIDSIKISNLTITADNSHIYLNTSTNVKSVIVDNVIFNHMESDTDTSNNATMLFWYENSGYDLVSITNSTFNYPNAGTSNNLIDNNGEKIDRAFVGQTWDAKKVVFSNNTINKDGKFTIRKGFELSGEVAEFTAENNKFNKTRWSIYTWLFKNSKDAKFNINSNEFNNSTTSSITVEPHEGSVLGSLNAKNNVFNNCTNDISIVPGTTINGGNMIGYYQNIFNVSDTTQLNKALDDAKNGDKIVLASGEYNSNININKTLELVGEGKDTTILNGKITASSDVIDSIKISNMTINADNQHLALWENTNVKSVAVDNVIFNHLLSVNQATMYFWGTQEAGGYDLISITNSTFNYPKAGTGSDIENIDGEVVDKSFVGQTYDADKVVFNNNIINQNAKATIRKGFELSGTVKQFTAENNKFDKTRNPIVAWLTDTSTNSQFRINNNTFNNSTTACIQIDEWKGTILGTLNARGNTFNNCTDEIYIKDGITINSGNMAGEYSSQTNTNTETELKEQLSNERQ